MSKQNTINKLTKLLSHGISHRIGSIVNKEDPYAEKYSKEAINFFNLARRTSTEENWNIHDKKQIKEKLKHELKNELERKDFLDNKKFAFIDSEIDLVLKELDLDV